MGAMIPVGPDYVEVSGVHFPIAWDDDLRTACKRVRLCAVVQTDLLRREYRGSAVSEPFKTGSVVYSSGVVAWAQ